VEVPLRRLARWLHGFEERHGGPLDVVGGAGSRWRVEASDGSVARVGPPDWLPGTSGSGGVEDLDHLAGLRPTYLVLLVRRAGYAAGLFHGDRLLARKVGSRHVHGRTAAGGWSQQRYARRRANQADEVAAAARSAAERILAEAGPGQRAEFLVTGGDRPLLASSLAAAGGELAALAARGAAVHVAVGTPDRGVLERLPDQVLSARIVVWEGRPPAST